MAGKVFQKLILKEPVIGENVELEIFDQKKIARNFNIPNLE